MLDNIEQKIASNYWLKKIKNASTVNELSIKKLETEKEFISNEGFSYFSKLTNANVLAGYTVLLSIFNALLCRYFEVESFIYSSKIKAEEIPLLFKFNSIKEKTLRAYLQDIKEELQEVYLHSNYGNKFREKYPFEKYSNYSFLYNIERIEVDSSIPFNLSVKKTEKGVGLEIIYDSSFVSHIVANHFLQTFKSWILNLEDNINENIEKIPIITQSEKKKLLETFNNTEEDYPRDKTIIDLFEEQVAKTPNNIAVVFEDKNLSYQDLNEVSNQLAHYLRENYLIQSDDLVGLKLDRSENLIIAIFGVLKSGAAYVPIDNSYPQERIAYIEEDINNKIVIDNQKLDQFIHNIGQYSKENIEKVNTPDSLAYVIYTSGTTGNPKGVMVEHRNVVRLVNPCSFFPLNIDNTLLSTGSISFDATIIEFFGTLLNGSKLVLTEQSNLLELESFENIIIHNSVDSLWMTASWFSQVVDNNLNVFKTIKQLIVGGDVVSPTHVLKVFEKYSAIKIVNGYGPTENTTFSTTFDIKNQKYLSIPIGKPVPNSSVYILDNQLQPLPLGVSGDLYVFGDGLARGYLNRPDLTAEKFIENPFKKGQKMYDTGDVARWLPDGNIEFMGRKDHQVKLRGYRIELGEIENTILSYSEGINQAVVIVNNETLIAYYTEKNSIDRDALKEYLKNKLPSYMMPSHFRVLEAIPLTSNGKIDRKALESLSINHKANSNYVAPRNETEQKLVRIWQEVLGIEKIGIRDNFFELGGHSLMIGQVINQIYKRLNGSITYKAFFQDPVIGSIAKTIKKENYIPIPKFPEQVCYSLTPSQHRIWVLSQLEGGDIAYNMPGVVVLKGGLDIDKFKKAFSLLINRHEILRTSFRVNEEGEVYQYIVNNNKLNFDVTFSDFKDWTKETIDEYIHQEQAKSFDLTKAPLLRATILNTGEKENLFSFMMHHIIGDGWSMELLISEIITTYNELLINEEFKNEEISVQYKDYCVWLQSQSDQEAYKVSEAYWMDKFKGELPVLDLPSFKKRPIIQTYKGKTDRYQFSKGFLSKIKRFSEKQDATLFMTLMAGINTLLYLYTNQNEIIIGTPIAGREHPDLENQIGLFLNTLAIRTKLDNGFSFEDLLQLQKQVLLESYQHQNYPFDELVSKLNLKRDTSRSALFDVMVVLQNQNQLQSISSNNHNLEGIEIESYRLDRDTSQFDVSFTFLENQETLHLEIEYNTDIYDEFLMTRIFKHFENLLDQAINNPKNKIYTINYLTEEESKQILEKFNNTELGYPKDKTIVDLFEEQVGETPDSTAVVFEEKELTYKELNEKANQLASYLRRNHYIQSDDLVAMKLDRSENLLVTILGILKSGGAYVPIDTNYPRQRIDYIEKDSNAKVIIDQLFLDKFEEEKAQYSKENLDYNIKSNNLAYVIYTSGTTGKPKGVMIEHKNVVSIHIDWKKQYKLDTFEINLLQLASVSFDVFVGDICRSLLNGGRMIIPANDIKLNPEALYDLIERHHVSIFEGTPGLLLPLLDYIKINNKDYSFLKRIIFGSDSFNNSTFNTIKDEFESSDLKIINSYGVTEATIDSTFYDDYNLNLQSTTPIGKPFFNSSIYILNSAKDIVPVGVFGELFVGGAGVSRGYYNRQELTQSKFIKIKQQKEKVYATGDIARWLPDGNIEFLGRNDHQIKIRGYRIELGEIESALHEFSENIKQVIVSVKEIKKEKTLIAFYVSSSTIEKTRLKSFLLEKLPDYMVPNFFVQLETIPLTPNGKIDMGQLPDISEKDVIKKEYIAPKNGTEEKLIHIWQEILEIERIGTKDDFFELGGHSLKITKLKNHITKSFNVSLSFNDLFLKTSIVEQAILIAEASQKEYQLIPQVPVQDFYPLSSAQQRIWVLSQFEGSNVAYNMPGVFAISGKIKDDVLQKVFHTLIERHEVLRTRFVQKLSGEVEQQVLSADENNFELIYKKQFKDASKEVIEKTIKKEIRHTFDLKNECLLRASLLQNKEDQFTLIVLIHHIISDAWSIDLLTNELFALYNSYVKRNDIPIQSLSIQYKDFAIWEQKELNSSKSIDAKEYWIKQFSKEIPVLELPYKQKRPLHKTYEGKIKNVSISEQVVSQFKELCMANDSTLFMGLLTLVKVLLYRYTNQKDIIIGSPIAGREHIQLQDQIGVYINTLALQTQLDGNDSFYEVLQKVKKTTTEAYTHQSYPFDKLIEDLKVPRNLNRNPLFDIMVTLQNTDQENKKANFIEGVTINEVKVSDNVVSKFDLDFVFEEVGGHINLSLIYNTSLFEGNFIIDFCNQFNNLVENIIKTPEIPIYDLQILTTKQYRTLLNNGTSVKNVVLDSEKTFLDFFKNWVTETPNAIAVQDNKSQLTYAELDKKSDGVESYLHKAVSEKETTIGVVLDRSVNTVVILLGILKSGKTYIPLDPTFPTKRLEYIVSNSETKTLICDEQFSFFDSEQIRVLTTTSLCSEINYNELTASIRELPKGEDTAYIIYTSGSTGNPKGVEVGHYSLMNLLLSIKEKPGIQPKDVLYAVTTYSFDISILEFFVPIISGASVFIASNETLSDAQKIVKDIDTVRPTIIQATPSFYRLLFNAGWEGNKEIKILCGGDSLSEALATQLLLSSKELWNMYGPTETTIWSSIKQIKDSREASNIGNAINNTLLYVLGEHQELLPSGSQGILYIGGDGLSEGYYKNKTLTKEKFIKNPFGNGFLYETGDIVKWNNENELLFLGRNDQQVKVRGYRIELGDVETKLNFIEGIDQAIVIVKKNTLNETVLVAYYTYGQPMKTSELKKQLKKTLPDYMIPSQFISVDHFPLTPNKKIDRKVLSEMNIEHNRHKEYSEPTTEIEKKLIGIWKEFFELDKISIDDNFFELGGHSLTATKLISRIQEEFSIKLSINKIFEYTTIQEQAQVIENTKLLNQISRKEDKKTEIENFTI